MNSKPFLARFVYLDALRLVSAVGIVWIHSVGDTGTGFQWNSLGRFGVPFFTLSGMYLMTRTARKPESPSTREYAYKRFVRLYIPFLIWNVIYTIARVVKNYGLGFSSDTPIFPSQVGFWEVRLFSCGFCRFC